MMRELWKKELNALWSLRLVYHYNKVRFTAIDHRSSISFDIMNNLGWQHQHKTVVCDNAGGTAAWSHLNLIRMCCWTALLRSTSAATAGTGRPRSRSTSTGCASALASRMECAHWRGPRTGVVVCHDRRTRDGCNEKQTWSDRAEAARMKCC